MSDDRVSRNEVFGQVPTTPGVQPGFGNDVPVDLIPIPSRGLVYAETSPAHLLTGIEVRAMMTGEEDVLTSKALQKKGTNVRELIQRCIITEKGKAPVQVSELLLGDRDTLLVAIRSLSYGPEYKAEITCPSCGVKEQKTFILNKLNLKTLDIDPLKPGMNAFPFTLPLSKRNILFKFPTVADEEEILLTFERMKKASTKVEDKNISMNLTSSIVAVDGVDDKLKISQVIRTMLAGDSLALRRYMAKNTPGVEMTQEVTCSGCGEDSKLDIPFGPEFFFPSEL